MVDSVRVRFAPSPTGPLHIGGVRTALYNYLYAKKNNGSFLLRVEDTDQKRTVSDAEEYIYSALEWLGIVPDESPKHGGSFGPYRQSERKEVYEKWVQILIDKGLAYYAFDAPEELEAHRKEHEKKGKTFIYNWHNRLKLKNSLSVSAKEVNEKIKSGAPYVVRFLMWNNGDDEVVRCPDIIRGNVDVDCKLLDDKILYKSDGFPTYHFANVVDDHLMKISHVIRGEEWLPSLALHIKLYDAFGWTAPAFAHLPLILKSSGKGKLSKRDGDQLGFPVFPIQWGGEVKGYRESGFLSEAVVNFLALLGWNNGDEQEVFSLEEMVALFDLNRVHHAGARFDPEKNKWFNQQHIQALSLNAFAQLCKAEIERHTQTNLTDEKLMAMAEMVQPRVVLLGDLWVTLKVFFEAPDEYDPKATKKVWKENTSTLLQAVANRLVNEDDLKADDCKTILQTIATDAGTGIGALMGPLRLVLVGSLTGPDLLQLVQTLGAQEVVDRINIAVMKIN